MTEKFIKFASIAGEIAPAYHGRSDLEKYDLAAAEISNFFVDYRGGLSTRTGTEFVDYVENDDLPTRFFDFKFAPDEANVYCILLGGSYIRFIQDGAYVLETAKTVTSVTNGAPNLGINATAHGYLAGDVVKFISPVFASGRLDHLYRVIAPVIANRFYIENIYGDDILFASYGAFTSAQVARVYTLVSPYATADLADLHAEQIKDTVRFTHANYPIKDLTRQGHTSWAFASTHFSDRLPAPTGVVGTPSNDDIWAVGFVVTAVNTDEEESLPSSMAFVTTVDYSVERGSVTLKWNPVPHAVKYRIYRTRIVYTYFTMSRSMQVGYVGESNGAHFVDANITPDFATTPPQAYNPFANGAIREVNITAGGAGYTNASLITATGATSGSGFRGYLVIGVTQGSVAGPVVGVQIIDGGKNYDAPVTFNLTGPGAGATMDAVLSEATGNNPRCSSLHQQRQVYAGTINDPLTIFGSRPGRLNNFDVSNITLQSDSYQHDVDASDVAPIEHMVSTRGGLILMSNTGIWQLTAPNGAAVTPTNAVAEPQAFKGSAKLRPIKVDTTLLYVEGKLEAVRLLEYNEVYRVYSGQDVSILASHLFKDDQLQNWCYAASPHKYVVGQRSDGRILCFTLIKEQNVYAWARWQTRGYFMDVMSMQEGFTDTIYTMVKRYIDGRWVKYIERFKPRDFTTAEEAWCLDAGIRLMPPAINRSLVMSGTTGVVTCKLGSAFFAPGDVGKIIRAGGGKLQVLTYISNVQVTAQVIREVTKVMPETSPPIPTIVQGMEWTMGNVVTSVTGAYHLRGQIVNALIDGDPYFGLVVSADGSIVLPVPGSFVLVGIPFRALVKALPPTSNSVVLEGQTKRVVNAVARYLESRGLKIGTRLEKLYPMKERMNEPLGEPTKLRDGVKMVALSPRWERENFTYFVVDDPLPATLLGFVLEYEPGDDKE